MSSNPNVITAFNVELTTFKHRDGTTHYVTANTHHAASNSRAVVHRACCEKEASDVASALNAALERAAYRFDN